jgi:hypothetical protein
MLRIPTFDNRLRLITITYGIVTFFWLSIEDNGVWAVTVFGLALALLLTIRAVMQKLTGKIIPSHWLLPGLALVGAMIGLGTSIATTALMLMKNALHSHLFPDYPPAQMLAILERAPVWTLAGGLIGLSLSFIWLALRREIDRGSA